MKRFLLHTVLFCLLSAAIFLLILSQADGYSDAFYLRFTSPRQHSLIIGTSKAAQGLRPTVFKKTLGLDIYNYAFTLNQSPYGPTYFESIQQKHKPHHQEGVFILAVDPWSISADINNPEDSDVFPENELSLATTASVNTKPNFQYLFNNLSGNYQKIIFHSNITFLHDDGWLEVNVPMDSKAIDKRTAKKVKAYRAQLADYHFSALRFSYLQKIIEYLNQYGRVFLVRLPVHQQLLSIENELVPNFNNKLTALIPLTNGYLDLTPFSDNFTYTDGNHLHKTSAKQVSQEIAEWIKGQ